MNVGQIRARVQARFGDTAGVEVTSADILNWINDGMIEVARRVQQPQAAATLVVTAGTASYSLTGFAADVLRLRSVMYDGSVLAGISMEEADTLLAGREQPGQTRGTPETFWLWADQINLWPAPDNSTSVLKLFYVKRPAVVTTDSDVPGIPVHMHGDLVDYVISMVLDTTGERDRAERTRDRFDAAAAQAAADAEWPQRDTYPHVTVSADDTWWG